MFLYEKCTQSICGFRDKIVELVEWKINVSEKREHQTLKMGGVSVHGRKGRDIPSGMRTKA